MPRKPLPSIPNPPPDTSDYDPLPSYNENTFLGLWGKWVAADRANQKVLEAQAALAELEPKLRQATKRHAQSKQTSSELFEKLHPKSRSIFARAFKKRKKLEGESSVELEEKEKLNKDFEKARWSEMATMVEADSMQARIDPIKAQLKRNQVLATEVDRAFAALEDHVAMGLNDLPDVRAARQRMDKAKAKIEQVQQKVADFERAKVTVQHAHHYYSLALKEIDSVQGGGFGESMLGGSVDAATKPVYKAASLTAGKAQICFNETLRVLEPYSNELSADISPEMDKLKEMQLLQAAKMFDLINGYDLPGGGLGTSMKLMLQRQEAVFASLTKVAVWVQDKVTFVEAEMRSARTVRDDARRELAAAWNSRMGLGLAAPHFAP